MNLVTKRTQEKRELEDKEIERMIETRKRIRAEEDQEIEYLLKLIQRIRQQEDKEAEYIFKLKQQIKKEVMVEQAIITGDWLYIEYTDQKNNNTARMVKPTKMLPTETNGPGFLAKCELRESPYRHFKFNKISKLVMISRNSGVDWEEEA